MRYFGFTLLSSIFLFIYLFFGKKVKDAIAFSLFPRILFLLAHLAEVMNVCSLCLVLYVNSRLRISGIIFILFIERWC